MKLCSISNVNGLSLRFLEINEFKRNTQGWDPCMRRMQPVHSGVNVRISKMRQVSIQRDIMIRHPLTSMLAAFENTAGHPASPSFADYIDASSGNLPPRCTVDSPGAYSKAGVHRVDDPISGQGAGLAPHRRRSYLGANKEVQIV